MGSRVLPSVRAGRVWTPAQSVQSVQAVQPAWDTNRGADTNIQDF